MGIGLRTYLKKDKWFNIDLEKIRDILLKGKLPQVKDMPDDDKSKKVILKLMKNNMKNKFAKRYKGYSSAFDTWINEGVSEEVEIEEAVNLKKLRKEYDKNEDKNYHTENYLLLAKAFGTSAEVKKVEEILKRNKKQGTTSKKDSDWMYKNIMKYYDKIRAIKPFTKEEVEMDEAKGTAYPATIDTLRKIVKDKQNQVVMFTKGQARVDTFTASAIIAVYDGLKKSEHKKTLEDMIKTKEGFLKTQAFAMKMVK